MSHRPIDPPPTLDEILGPCEVGRIHELLDLAHRELVGEDRDGAGRQVLARLWELWHARAQPLILVLIRGRPFYSEHGAGIDRIPANQVHKFCPGNEPVEEAFPPYACSTRYEVITNPTLVDWLAVEAFQLESAAMRGYHDLHAMLRAFARLAAQATRAGLTAILEALARLRDGADVAPADDGPGTSLRELIARLRSPTVLAAGGGCCWFVPRT